MFRYCFILMIFLCSGGNAFASWADSLFEELNRDFGSVPRGPVLHHTFRLTNNTSTPVHISGVRVSCGCVSASPLQYELAPGQSSGILAQIDTRRFTGVKSVTIYVNFDQPQWDEVHLVVQANSREDVTLTPESLAFGQMKRGTAPTASVQVSFLGSGQWQILDVYSESNYVQPSVKELRRENYDAVYHLTAQIRHDVPVGKWYTDIWLRTSNPATPRIRVPLTVEVEPPLSISPAAAVMGQVKMGVPSEYKITVRGPKPFRIVGVKGGDGQINVRGSSEDSKSLHILTITLKAAKAGEQNWNLRVLTDLKEDGEVGFQARAHVVP